MSCKRCSRSLNEISLQCKLALIAHPLLDVELDVELDSLRTRFARIACLDMKGERLQSASFKTYDCYLFGNEARGVPREQLAALNAQPFTIAGCGAIESLNLAATVNMCAYELNR